MKVAAIHIPDATEQTKADEWLHASHCHDLLQENQPKNLNAVGKLRTYNIM